MFMQVWQITQMNYSCLHPGSPIHTSAHCLWYHNQDTDLDLVEVGTLTSQGHPWQLVGALQQPCPTHFPPFETALGPGKHRSFLLVWDFAISRFCVRGVRVYVVVFFLADLYSKAWTSCYCCQCHSLKDIWLFPYDMVVLAYNPSIQ